MITKQKLLIPFFAICAIYLMTGCAIATKQLGEIDCDKAYSDGMSIVLYKSPWVAGITECSNPNMPGLILPFNVKLEEDSWGVFTPIWDRHSYQGFYLPPANGTDKYPGEYNFTRTMYYQEPFSRMSLINLPKDICKLKVGKNQLIYVGDIYLIPDTASGGSNKFPVSSDPTNYFHQDGTFKLFGPSEGGYQLYVNDECDKAIDLFKKKYPKIFEKYKNNIVNYSECFLYGAE